MKYICQYCGNILDEEETLIDVDGPLCKTCYDELYHYENGEEPEEDNSY